MGGVDVSLFKGLFDFITKTFYKEKHMNILVTGCSGYIGGTFTYEALKEGHTI
jgi:Nucleoside-diphosphate-sugar epimerases